MAQTVSDEDLAKQAAKVEKLRAQVEDAERTRVERERDQANAITMEQLLAEEARLTAQLAASKGGATMTAIKEGASGPLDAAREERKVAEAQGAAASTTPTGGEGS